MASEELDLLENETFDFYLPDSAASTASNLSRNGTAALSPNGKQELNSTFTFDQKYTKNEENLRSGSNNDDSQYRFPSIGTPAYKDSAYRITLLNSTPYFDDAQTLSDPDFLEISRNASMIADLLESSTVELKVTPVGPPPLRRTGTFRKEPSRALLELRETIVPPARIGPVRSASFGNPLMATKVAKEEKPVSKPGISLEKKVKVPAVSLKRPGPVPMKAAHKDFQQKKIADENRNLKVTGALKVVSRIPGPRSLSASPTRRREK